MDFHFLVDIEEIEEMLHWKRCRLSSRRAITIIIIILVVVVWVRGRGVVVVDDEER